MGRKGGGTMTPLGHRAQAVSTDTESGGTSREAVGSPMLTQAVSSSFNLEYTTSLKSYFLILGYVNFKRS